MGMLLIFFLEWLVEQRVVNVHKGDQGVSPAYTPKFCEGGSESLDYLNSFVHQFKSLLGFSFFLPVPLLWARRVGGQRAVGMSTAGSFPRCKAFTFGAGEVVRV